MASEVLDLRGLKCPLPALFAKRALSRASAGAHIEILTDDPMAPVDVPHMCRHEEAQAAIRRARELDPLYVMHQSLSSQIAFAARIPLHELVAEGSSLEDIFLELTAEASP